MKKSIITFEHKGRHHEVPLSLINYYINGNKYISLFLKEMVSFDFGTCKVIQVSNDGFDNLDYFQKNVVCLIPNEDREVINDNK